MATLTWEHLPKNNIDNETIEQAIVRIVTAHNEDNTAHMAAGQSIDIHRKEGVLDHKLGSVLADKETASELKYYTTFESLTSFDVYGQVSNNDQLGVSIWVSGSGSVNSGLALYSNLQNDFLNTNQDFLFQILLRYEFPDNNYHSYFGFLADYTISEEGVGFQVQNNVLYTQVKCGSFTNRISHNTISLSSDNIYRVQYIAGERKVYFIVNGVTIHTVTIPEGEEFSTSASGGIEIKKSNSNSYYLRVSSLQIARSI